MKLTAIILALFVAGCTTVQAPQDAKQIWCAFNQPRAPLSNADTAPKSEVDEHNAYQDKGIAWCGWKVKA